MAAGCGDQAQFVAIVAELRSQNAWLLEKVAIQTQRRDHVSGVVHHLVQSLARVAQRGQGFHDRFNPLVLDHA